MPIPVVRRAQGDKIAGVMPPAGNPGFKVVNLYPMAGETGFAIEAFELAAALIAQLYRMINFFRNGTRKGFCYVP